MKGRVVMHDTYVVEYLEPEYQTWITHERCYRIAYAVRQADMIHAHGGVDAVRVLRNAHRDDGTVKQTVAYSLDFRD